MKKLILLGGLLFAVLISFAQSREGDFTTVIVRDSIIMTGGKITDMGDGVFDDDAATLGQVNDSIIKYSFIQPIDSLQLNPNIPDPSGSPTQYVFWGDSLTGSIAFHSKGVDFLNYVNATVEFPFINTTGETIPIGTPMSSDILDFSAGRGMVTVEFTECDDLGLAQTYAGITNEETLPGEIGQILNFSLLGGYNTTGFNVRDILYVGCDSTITNVEPSPPLYKIIVGRVLIVGVNGVIAVTSNPFTGSDTDINLQGYLNGIVTKTPAIRDTIIGGILYYETFNENVPADNLPYMFNKIRYNLNTTTNTGTNGYARVALTYGTTSNAQSNYIYIDHNSGSPVLSVNTTGFPEDGLDIAHCGVWDQATHLSTGFAFFQRSNNSVNGSNAQGLQYRTVRRIRLDGSKYESGIDPTVTIVTDGAAVDSFKISTTSGLGSQFNQQVFGAQSGQEYIWFNSPTGDSIITDLNQIDVDDAGNTLRANNTRYGLNIFGILNSGGVSDRLGVTTPLNSYSSDATALADNSNYAVTSVPSKYGKTAIRLYRVVVNYSTTSNGTLTNLVGVGGFQPEFGFPLGASGSSSSSGGAITDFSDADITIFNSADPTKIMNFDISNAPTGTTVTVTAPVVSDTMAVYSDLIDSIFTTENIAFSSDSINYTKDGVTYNVTEIRNPDGIDQGGIVTLETGLIYNISPCKYQINGVPFESVTSQETLTTADPTNPRIDIIVVDTFGVTDIVTGVAAANPQKPTANPESQIELTSILVNAGATTGEPGGGGGEAITVVYDENVEWVGGQSGTTVDFASATDPFHGTINAEVTNISDTDWIKFTTPTPILATDLTNFSMYLKLKEAASKKHRLYVQLIKDDQGVSNFIQLPMDYTNTSWQNLSVSLEGIYLGQDSIDEVQLVWAINPDATFSGFYIDLVQLQGGYDQPATIQPHTHPISDIIELGDTIAALDTGKVSYINPIKNVDLGLFDLYADSLSITNGITVGGDVITNGTLANPNEIRISNAGGSDWGVDKEIGRYSFYSTDGSGIGARELASIRGVSGNAEPTNSSGELVFYISPLNSNSVVALRLNDDVNAIFSGIATAKSYGTTEQSLTETAGAVAWDVSDGSEVGVTIDETSIITLTSIPVGWKGNIDITQGDAGDDNVTFVSSGYTVKWRDDDQDLTDDSGAVDVVSLRVRGTVIYVTWGGPYVAQ